VDYSDTYSLVLRIISIRMLIVITCINKLEILQMNVKKTFLSGDLNEEVYIWNNLGGFVVNG
jgi:hypothetical protein